MADNRELIDRILDGGLRTALTAKRAEHATFDDIARWLEDEHGIKVSRESVRRWCADWEIPEAAA